MAFTITKFDSKHPIVSTGDFIEITARRCSDKVSPLTKVGERFVVLSCSYMNNANKTIQVVVRHPKRKKAFAGFGCSWGGKYFGGYARNNRGRNYCNNAKRTLLKDITKMQNVKFGCKDYRDIEYNNALIYCDPPYEKKTEYTTGSFDSNTFWQWCRDMQARGNTVIVSEYKAPDDFECIWSKNVKLGLRTKNGCENRVEKLFTPMAQTIR